MRNYYQGVGGANALGCCTLIARDTQAAPFGHLQAEAYGRFTAVICSFEYLLVDYSAPLPCPSLALSLSALGIHRLRC